MTKMTEIELERLDRKQTKTGETYYEDREGKVLAKRCTKCGEDKLARSFVTSGGNYLRMTKYCKVCLKGIYDK